MAPVTATLTVATTYTDRNQAEDIDYTPFGGSASTLATMTYDAGMRQTLRELGNGLEEARTYRDDNLLDTLTVETAPANDDRQGLSFDYGYDANKNMTSEDTGGVMDDFGIDLVQDAKDRMTSWTRDTTNTGLDSQSWNLSYESDWDDTTVTDGGTGVTQERTHNDPHELLTIDPDGAGGVAAFSQTHDAKGNLTADGDGLLHTFDFDNMLKQVVVSGSSPRGIEGTHTYAYDALGRRVSKTVDTNADNTPDETTVFVYAGNQVIAEYEGGAAASAPERQYIFCATGYIDEPIALIDDSEDVYYYHRNRQFTIIGLTDDTGTVIERYAYTAYGTTTVLDANAAADADNISDVLNPYTYTGRRLDAETGLHYFRARYHDSVLGRFLVRDPLGYPDGLNTYAAYYVMHGGVDPWGMQSKVKHKDYFDEWVQDNPFLTEKEKEEAWLMIARGCIGTTCLHTGGDSQGYPDMSRCYRKRERAEEEMSNLRDSNGCPCVEPRLFSIHLYNPSDDPEFPALVENNPRAPLKEFEKDFIPEDADGLLDLSKWANPPHKETSWQRSGFFRNIKPSPAFDFGAVNENGDIVHGSAGILKQVEKNGVVVGVEVDPALVEEHNVLISTTAEWSNGWKPGANVYNMEVWCVTCNEK